MKNKLLLFGGGGHCKSILDCIISQGQYDDIGIVDYNTNASIMGIPIVGTDDDIIDLMSSGWNEGFVAVGSLGDTSLRRKLYQRIKNAGLFVPTIIDSSAVVSKNTIIENGVFIGKNVVINAGCRIGTCAILNTGAIVEHDCSIGCFSHISSGTVMCGGVSVGADAHIGAGSVVRQGINIGGSSLIGAGSVIVKDIPDNVKAFGSPCKVVY